MAGSYGPNARKHYLQLIDEHVDAGHCDTAADAATEKGVMKSGTP